MLTFLAVVVVLGLTGIVVWLLNRDALPRRRNWREEYYQQHGILENAFAELNFILFDAARWLLRAALRRLRN